MKTYLLIFASLYICSGAFAQDDENWRIIPSVTEWIEEINNWPEEEYDQEYLIINFDYEKDLGLIATSEHELDSFLRFDTGKKAVINKPVTLNQFYINRDGDRRAEYYEGNWLVNIHFTKSFKNYNVRSARWGFINCHFGGLYQPRLMQSPFVFAHYNCQFDRLVNINNPKSPTPISFKRCVFGSLLSISANDATPSLRLDSCQFELVTLHDKMDNIFITDCQFNIGLSLSRLKISSSIDIYYSRFGVLNIQGTVLPSNNTYISFDSLQNKLGLLWGGSFWDMADLLGEVRNDRLQKEQLRDSILAEVYYGRSDEELMKKAAYDQLIASYYKLLNVYKVRGEMDSYNSAYIEMRNKMTKRSELLYKQYPSFNRYFDWQINRFTRAFSDYGTRPAKAIVIFFQVVLGFSVFYFFFPSTWNTSNSRKLMKRLSYLGGYFTSKEGLSDLFEKETKDQFQDYEEFRTFMASSEKELPVYFKWLSKPLYQASVSRFNLSKGFLKRTDILNGKWSELPSGKKALTSFLIGVYLFFYLLFVLVVRCLNAITLSLNAFSTLGFGEIPTRGIARYMTIIQGFIGWFLLSIFLVSLIGQILN
jgi:hypothetical protein